VSHFQIVKDHARIHGQFAHFLSNTAHPFTFNDTHGESPEARHVFRAMAFVYSAAILVIIPVYDVMSAVLDTPVFTVVPKHPCSTGLIWGFAGNPVGHFPALLAAFFTEG